MALFKTLATAAILASTVEAVDEKIHTRLKSTKAIEEDTKAFHDSLIKLFDLRPMHLDNDTGKTEKNKLDKDGKAKKT